MNKFLPFLFYLLVPVCFFSCWQSNVDEKKDRESEVIRIQNADSNYTHADTNIVESYFKELSDKSPELKKLEEDMRRLNSESKTPIDKYDAYSAKSKEYYKTAETIEQAITDSFLRIRMKEIIMASQFKYANTKSEVDSILNIIARNKATIQDHYAMMKIILTLPLIEKHQYYNLPDKLEFKDLHLKQEQLLQRIDSLALKR